MRYAGAVALVLVVVLMLLAPSALAQPAPAATAPAEEEAGGMVAVERGQPAPFAGILMTEEEFTRAAGLQLRLDEAEGRLRNRDAALAEAATRQAALEAALSDARSSGSPPCEGSWWSRHGFTVGVVAGVAATVAATALLLNATVDSGG